ncbi:helix-turn-helix transcriptional regulator [Nonomuraea rubra]|uniref:DNA-binding CsgD family transcriptional regulator n=2 Tax=Nonomuraea rubra TaxID=46180 RepID=A0A7X0U3J7_9ACTN|nr:helix-turn-helix transcriptional regulator [Nonomuraea rubra]MBB6553768.1 DNA-binding CsgD family transcriptional regulator [Nonomuraea rubra]
MLHGRERECALIARLLDGARERRSAVLVVRGEAGIGKSALLGYAAARADGMRVLRGGGVESESELPYAAAHQLLRPVADRLAAIPAGQAAALRAAFGLGEPVEGDRFLVSVAVLSLLSEAAEERPLLCLVDDAHWLDGGSADALAFVARRLEAEGVVLLFAARDEEPGPPSRTGTGPPTARALHPPAGPPLAGTGVPRPLAGLPELRLGGLDAGAAQALLAERTSVSLAPEVAALLVTSTAGNPLGLLELPGSLSAEQLAGTRPLPERLPVGEVVEQVFLARVRRLGAPAQTLLLIAAAEDSGDVGLVLRAARTLALAPDALDEAEHAGLVRVDGGALTFRHPLVRSAVYRGATFLQRQAVEQALAAVLADEDADRRAWHLAAAATGPDETVAGELEASAERATRRGGHASAASALHRAADLTGHPEPRARRLTLAAETAWLAGQPDRARTLLDEAATRTAEPRLRARGEHVRGAIEGLCGRPDLAYAMLVAGAELVSPPNPAAATPASGAGGPADRAMGHDPSTGVAPGREPGEAPGPDPGEVAGVPSGREAAQAARMLIEAGRLAFTAADLPRLAEAGRRLAGLPPVEEAVTAGGKLMIGLAALLEGDAERAATLLREGRALAKDSADPQSLTMAAGAAMFVGEDMTALDLFTTAAVRARTAGAVSALPLVLAPLGALQMWTGRFAAARATATEGLRLALDTRQDNIAAHHRAVLAWIAAVQGRAEECRTEADAALSRAIGQRLGPPAGIASWALALLDLGEGRTGEAFDRLTALADAAPGEGHPIVKIFAAADLVEVAVRADRPDRAATALDLLRRWAGPARSAWADALVSRCRGLVENADDHFTEALSSHAQAGRPFDTARTALLFGEALRRRRRRAESRRHLRAAREIFERLDAAPWAALARVELQATGETARKRDPSTSADLTPQESQIARMVSEGGTNREIAAYLFLSPRTVDYHLHKVFVKLGLSSRAELVRLALERPGLLDGEH